MNVICFHNPEEENGYLSNWYLSDFVLEGVTFSSMEQYMMWSKAKYFGDSDSKEKILATSDVKVIKELGRGVKNYDECLWNGIRQIVVYRGLLAKFTQDESLGAQLKATGSSILAECAVRDLIWGIGLSMHDRDRFDTSKWRGKNLLGYALMLVREEIS